MGLGLLVGQNEKSENVYFGKRKLQKQAIFLLFSNILYTKEMIDYWENVDIDNWTDKKKRADFKRMLMSQ